MNHDDEKLESVVRLSENGFQESQFSASSNNRMKVDVLNGRENGDSKEQVLPGSKCNLRMSLAWDSAFFTSPGVLESEELLTALNSRNFDNVVNILGNEEYLLLSSQSLEPDTNRKAENYNFRKSLAWDNGFFTSEGVLNPFELAIVNNGFKKSESHLLPVIEDEVWKSMESYSTLDSEGSSLTRLEMDLFEDIRPSMPRPTTSSFERGRPASAEQDGSRTMMKAKPTCRRQSVNKHGTKTITRERPNAPKIQLKHTAESREHNSSSSLKPPNVSEQTNCVSRGSTKRASLGEKHVKLGSRSGISARAVCLGKSKKPCLRDSFYAIHGSTQSLRSSLLQCSASTKNSVSEITIGKSSTNLRRKVNSQGTNILTTGSALTTPLVKTRANKMEVESSCQSTPASSWYGSPSSSIDDWSSESSSTSAAKRSNRCKPSPYSSLRSSRMENHAREESHAGHETSVNQRHRKDHNGDGNTDTSCVSREVKPSGLRMPSPKLGFFDAENMLELATTKGVIAEGTAVANAKGAAAHRTQCTKLRSPGTQPSNGSRKLDPRKNGGTPVSVSAVKGNRNPTKKSHDRTLQSCNKNQSLKAEQINVQYPELDFQISHDGNKENEVSFVDHQLEGLVKQVNSIDLNSDVIIHFSGQN